MRPYVLTIEPGLPAGSADLAVRLGLPLAAWQRRLLESLEVPVVVGGEGRDVIRGQVPYDPALVGLSDSEI
jgi:hypothetical protein